MNANSTLVGSMADCVWQVMENARYPKRNRHIPETKEQMHQMQAAMAAADQIEPDAKSENGAASAETSVADGQSDGKTIAELYTELFAILDEDDSGSVQMEELTKISGGVSGPCLFAELDLNDDGDVSFAEFKTFFVAFEHIRGYKAAAGLCKRLLCNAQQGEQ